MATLFMLLIVLNTFITSAVHSATLHRIVGWSQFSVENDAYFNGTFFAVLPVDNSQQCLRLCWLYKACTLLTYVPAKGFCQLTSIDVADMTSFLVKDVDSVTVDMRLTNVDEPKPRGCDKRPCDVGEMCVPVVKTSSYECLTTAHTFCPGPTHIVANAAAMNDGVNNVVYRCLDGHLATGHGNMSTCDRTTGRWSDVGIACKYVDCGAPPDVANAKHQEGPDTSFNAKVTYTCLEGHVSDSVTLSITCQENSQWTEPPAGCMYVLCPEPVEFPNASVHLLDRNTQDSQLMTSGVVNFERSIGGKALHSCNAGFTSLVNDFVSECLPDGSWSTDVSMECSRVDCGRPPVVANAWSSHNATTFQSTVDYLCKEGYLPNSEDMRLECNETGSWEGPEMTCELQDCGQPPEEEHATASYNGTGYNEKVNYTCKYPGISFTNGDDTRSCQANGHWSNETIKCLWCGSPPDVINGTYSIEFDEENDTYSAMYVCDEGFSAQDVEVAVCRYGQTEWTTVPSCTLTMCPEPASVENATVVYDNTAYGSTLIYNCLKGFKPSIITATANFINISIIYNITFTCSDSSDWVNEGDIVLNTFSCVPLSCGDPPLVQNADYQTTDLTFGYNSTITYHCSGKMVLITSSNTKRCTLDGWDDTPVLCEDIPCGPLPEVDNAQVDSVDMSIQPVKVSYKCDEGYRPISEAWNDQRCVATFWIPKEVGCLPVECGSPPNLANASVIATTTVYQAVATYECNTGFTPAVNTSLTRTCQADGTWSLEVYMCSEVDCGNPPSWPNSIAHFNGSSLGSVVTYSCQEGFTFSPDYAPMLTLKCVAPGSWYGVSGQEATNASCFEINCGEPPAIDFAMPLFNSTIYKSNVIYTCDDDYIISGVNSKECTATGNWTGDNDFNCSPTKCADAPDVAHAHKEYLGNRSIDTEVVYSCESGYRLARDINSSTCLENLQWSKNAEGFGIECVFMNCGVVSDVWNADDVVYYVDVDQTIVAEYSCHDGYFAIDGLVKRYCSSSGGEWSTDFVECALNGEIICPEPNEVDHAVNSITSRRRGGKVRYTCQAGYEHWWFESNNCTQAGVWTDKRVQCNLVHCGSPPDVEHATKHYDSISYESVVEYTCENAFQHSSQKFKRCQADGEWSRNLVECIPAGSKACSLPPSDENSTISYSSLKPDQAIATYTCNPGYTANGKSFTKLCGADSVWRHHEGNDACRPVKCLEAPRSVDNAYMIAPMSWVFGSSTVYNCKSPLTRIGPESRRCMEDGTWEDVSIECIAMDKVRCPEPVLPENAYTLVTSYKVGAAIQFYCKAGFTGTGNGICNTFGEWEWDRNRCEPLYCFDRPPRVIDAEMIHHNEYNANAVVAYKCFDGFRQTGAYRSKCLDGQYWTNVKSTCQPLDECEGDTPQVAKATAVIKNDSIGVYVNYTCEKNYAPLNKSNNIIRCSDFGQWLRNDFRCQPIGVCANPPEIPNAEVADLIELDAKFAPNILKVYYRCLEGYVKDTTLCPDCVEIENTCDNSTKWTMSPPTCVPIDCGKPAQSLHGMYQVEFNETTYMSEARIQCLNSDSGVNISVCQQSGNWSDVGILCPEPCTPPPSIANGTIVQINNATEWRLDCIPDFKYLGPATVSCTYDEMTKVEKWTGRPENWDDVCFKKIYNDRETDLVVEIPIHKREYFNRIKICLTGDIISGGEHGFFGIFFTGIYPDPGFFPYYPIRAYVKPDIDRIRIAKRVDSKEQTIAIKNNKLKGQTEGINICIAVSFDKRKYDVSSNGERLYTTNAFSDFQDSHNRYFYVRQDVHITQLEIVYFK